MPRIKRKAEATPNPLLEDMLETLAVLDRSTAKDSGRTVEEVVAERERASAKWARREAKALARWRRMSPIEQKAWADECLRGARKYNTAAKMPKAGELPHLFATLTVAERWCRKHEKAEAKRREAEGDNYAGHLAAADAGKAVARARSAPPVLEEIAASAESTKPTKKRRGPAYGAIGQMVDGVFYYYDDEDER